MPEDVAYRYVFIPHVPGFWDHILVGTRAPPKMEKMIGPDDYLPKLFDVFLGVYKFHWCCFVLKKQIILAMWCTAKPRIGDPKVFSVLDNMLKGITERTAFRKMIFYLSRWFTNQYVAQSEDASQSPREPPNDRQLKVVLDCKPSEGLLVNLITLLAYKCGMEKVEPGFSNLPGVDVSFNLENAKVMFTCPSETNLEIDTVFFRTSGATGN
ncbi:uncharacterized protein LOC130191315 [Pseudoliparis swirei]|uniref:uncharacterized protein LOC130191315 n=1 Tax=Pseudoliparis swirei TaxID=2059687 RepID=UPI0024BD690D|nr:uncharacterized protein LOC130191315 [Pseudoliparis swirei]